MVGVSALMAEAEATGLAVRADGDKLVVQGPRRHEALSSWPEWTAIQKWDDEGGPT